MKNFYLFLLLGGSFVAQAQQILVQGALKDQQTNEAVISASIGVKGKASGTISNEEGHFQLGVSAQDVVVITCLGYQSREIKASDFPASVHTLLLAQSEEILEEVMVTKVPLHEMLLQIVATSTARLNKPVLLHTYYREFAKSNGKYSSFADGMLDYHIGGSAKKTTSELVVLQNRSANLATPEEEEDDMGSLIGVQRAVSSNYSMRFLVDNVLDGKHYKDYEFELKSKKEGGQELYVISFEPKDAVEKMLYKGAVVFDPATDLVWEADIASAASHLQYAKTINLLIARVIFLEAKLKVGYKMVGNNYVLSYNNRFSKIKIFNKKHSELVESRSDLLVTDFEKDAPYNKKLRYTKKKLQDKPTQYTSKFWQDNNAIVLTADEQQIISALESQSK